MFLSVPWPEVFIYQNLPYLSLFFVQMTISRHDFLTQSKHIRIDFLFIMNVRHFCAFVAEYASSSGPNFTRKDLFFGVTFAFLPQFSTAFHWAWLPHDFLSDWTSDVLDLFLERFLCQSSNIPEFLDCHFDWFPFKRYGKFISCGGFLILVRGFTFDDWHHWLLLFFRELLEIWLLFTSKP